MIKSLLFNQLTKKVDVLKTLIKNKRKESWKQYEVGEESNSGFKSTTTNI